MFNIDIKFDNIHIINVEKKDILDIENWIKREQEFNVDALNNYEIKEFNERYLEYYLSEGEYFLKILCDNKLIGIIKGRIEFKNPNEVWIMCYLLENSSCSDNKYNDIINEFFKYLYKNYGICNFYTFISVNSPSKIAFWKSKNFEVSRITNNFLKSGSDEDGILILKKTL